MNNSPELKLFISYSHADHVHVDKFRRHIAPLKSNGLIKDWIDREIIAGEEFQNSIDNNLEDADIICLFISANFLSSNSCDKEKIDAYELNRKKGVSVVPVILSECGWLDVKDLSKKLALPEDGKAVTKFDDENSGWHNVYEGLKKVIESENLLRGIKVSEKFNLFLNDAELLTKAHSKKEEIKIDDIYIYPDLLKYDEIRGVEKKINAEDVIVEIFEYNKILIAGENQSGKTTLCKVIYKNLFSKKYYPIYLSDEKYDGQLINKIKKEFEKQYQGCSYDLICKSNRIVVIVDNFHHVLQKDRIIDELSTFDNQLLIVDEIFSLNIRDENISKNYKNYKIKEFNPILRNELIKKWICLDGTFIHRCHDNELYKSLDDATELVNSTLGKVINSGIMPSYPFFILSVLSTYESFAKPLDQEITSQGYCYQSLIYLYLRKSGVKTDEIDTYVNFLSVIAHQIFKMKLNELNLEQFNSFIDSYNVQYNLSVNLTKLLHHLKLTKIFSQNSCGNYCFVYPYLYYYFVAKYLAEHLEQNKEIINRICANLHVDVNAYIAIFITHHTKNDCVLEEIVLNSTDLFYDNKPADLSLDELSFFDDEIETLISAALPADYSNPEAARQKRLELQDKIEQDQAGGDKEELNDEFAIELRRSIKTVEVMGSIVKNRAGSLKKKRIEEIINESMDVHLRILFSFFEFIRDKNQQSNMIAYLSSRINEFISDQEKKPSEEKLKKIAHKIFWNLNYSVIYSLINVIINSIGSDKLQSIINKICDIKNTPASFLIKHGTLMWFSKNILVDEMADRIKENDFSKTSIKILNHLVVNHCSLHSIDFKEKQKISLKLGIPIKSLLSIQMQRNQ